MLGKVILVGGLLLISCSAGCAHDPRISLTEFLEIQRGFEQQSQPEEKVSLPPEVIDAAWQPYRVGPGDSLTVVLSGLDASVVPIVEATVDREGVIDLPMVGELKVAELELEDVEAAIEAAYVPSKVRDLAVHVAVSFYDTTEVTVVGAVMQPGTIPLLRHQRNMLFAVLAAGGVTQGAASGKVTLQRLRRPAEVVEFDLLDPYSLQAALALDALENGDIVTVEAAVPNTIYVGGLVNAPAPQLYAPGTQVNILQAIASAGGLRTDVTPREGTLIRRMPDGKDYMVKLDLNRIARCENPEENILLVAGDIFWVPETTRTRLQDFVNRNFFLRVGASASVNYNVAGVEYLNRRTSQSRRFNQGGLVGQSIQTSFDPFGFLSRNSALQNLQP